jgi:subtilisin-like proprotein convertase family protein
MKNTIVLTSLISLWMAGAVQATLITIGSSPDVAVPDGNPVGVSYSATESGSSGAIQNVDVNLNITGGYNGDLYGYLVLNTGSSSYMSVLLNRLGTTSSNPAGYGDAGMNVTLSGLGGNDIHLYNNFSTSFNGSGQLTGTYSADGRLVDPATVVSTDGRGAKLDVFNGQSANGTWTLFLADLSGGSQSTLVSWSADISVVPEPINWALAGFAGILAAAKLAAWRAARRTA